MIFDCLRRINTILIDMNKDIWHYISIDYLIQKFDPEVLREYDIRGVVNDNINENTAYTIGRTFGFVVQSKTNSNNLHASSSIDKISSCVNL